MRPTTAYILWATAFALCVAFASSCRPTVDCEDLGCAFGLVCDTDTGECVPREADCREDPDVCDASEVCDPQTGNCQPSVTLCADSGSCPNTQICDAQTGTCRAATRCTIDGCEAQEVCNATTDRCEPRPCLEDVDCPSNSGFICGDSGVCVQGCRASSTIAACPEDQTCVVQSGEGVGVCQERCAEDTDCAFGQVCVAEEDRTRCELEPPCAVDADCRPDEVCLATTCSQPSCNADADCEVGQVCQVASGLCFGGDCAEDQFGNGVTRPPNHARETAFPLTDSDPELSGLVLCPGRSDWFRASVRTTEIILARVTVAQPAADVDLYVWDEEGNLLAADTALGSRSSVRFDGRSNQPVFFEIRPTGERSVTYDLEIGRDFCDTDNFEENDDANGATIVPTTVDSPSLLELRVCGFDQDWFKLPDIGAEHGLRVELRNGSADLRGTLVTPDGVFLPIRNDAPLEFLRAGAAGDYLLRVVAERGRSSDYELLFEVSSTTPCPDSGTFGSPADAAPAPPDDTSSFLFCPSSSGWEIDWIALETPTDGLLDLTFTWTNAHPSAEVTLVYVESEMVTPVKTVPITHGSARVIAQFSTRPQRSWYLRVTSNAAVGRLAAFPEYTVDYTVTTQ